MQEGRYQAWLTAASVYRDRRVWAILFFGFASGLPLALTFGTLSLWLAEEGISKTTIGLFALVGTTYTFKFLWAPLIDRLPLPLLTRHLGRRRGWLIVIQLLLIMAIIGLGASNPAVDPLTTALWALAVSTLSASQDIVIDAYRVEILDERRYGAGAAMVVLGYRIGMLASGAGALYLATAAGWQTTYLVMALLMVVGILTTLLNPEPVLPGSDEPLVQERSVRRLLGRWPSLPDRVAGVLVWLHGAVVAPFAEFVGRRGWLVILLFILLYKFGDALAGVMTNPFYLELGFSKVEIANISKLFGLAATIVGGVVGGVVVSRFGILNSLLYCGVLQALSNLMFALLATVGYDLQLLTVTIALENLSGGMGTAAFVAYLSSLCNIAYTATQYALLSSFMAFGRTLLSSGGGWMADQVDWVAFFLLTTLAALPGLLLIRWLTGLEQTRSKGACRV
jgi:PAT family beta-lactamase induction signal transducer AmpG